MSTASYNSDIDALKVNIVNSNIEVLGNITKYKNYEGINKEISNSLYKEKTIFGISSVIAIIATVITVKSI
jgi:precorrin-2 methylase